LPQDGASAVGFVPAAEFVNQGGEVRKVAAAVAVLGSLAFAGGAIASGGWVITSMNQIKPSVRQHLRGNIGPQGPQGSQGPQGPQGAQGPAGLVPQVVLVQSEHLTLQPGQDSFEVDPNGFVATCPAGYTVLGTGFNGPFPPTGGFVQNFGTFVGGFFANESSIPLSQVYLQATCGQVSGGFTGMVRRNVADAESQYHAQLRKAQATAR
jgi:hypothetical protein